jgi:hypothetical protein
MNGMPPILFRDPTPHGPPLLPNPTTGPDWAALVDALLGLRQLPDWAGETTIDSDEAASIRACGWSARKGLWRCPTIPPEFLLPGLWHLADDIDPAMRPAVWHAKRAACCQISPMDPLSNREHQLIRLIRKAPGGRLTRRQLQQRVSRRIWTRLLDHMLHRLRAQDYITVSPDGWIYPFGRAEFDAGEQHAREPRCPKPLYAR